MSTPFFLSCDWGTSRFRLRLVETETLTVRAEIASHEGVASLSERSDPFRRSAIFEGYFIDRVQELLRSRNEAPRGCIISGMASSNIGWHELPYACTPITPSPEVLETRTFGVEVPGLGAMRVLIVSGIRTSKDIMRGEETELLGLFELMPELAVLDTRIILPGTHSKHALFRNGVLQSFTTYMTGELFAWLPHVPTLASSLAGGSDFHESQFAAGVGHARREGFLASLFKIRSHTVLAPQTDRHGPSFLSGLLIGSELLESRGPARTYLCASAPLSDRYAEAARLLGLALHQIPAEFQTQSVLRAHRRFLSLPDAL